MRDDPISGPETGSGTASASQPPSGSRRVLLVIIGLVLLLGLADYGLQSGAGSAPVGTPRAKTLPQKVAPEAGPRWATASEKAKHQRLATEITMRKMEGSLKMYALKNKGRYPSTAQGLAVARKYFPNNDLPKDAWGGDFVYYSPGTHSQQPVELISLGRDGRAGGEGADADIKSWELEE